MTDEQQIPSEQLHSKRFPGHGLLNLRVQKIITTQTEEDIDVAHARESLDDLIDSLLHLRDGIASVREYHDNGWL